MQKTYFDKVHKWGILWDIGAILVLLSVPIIICVNMGVWPDVAALKVVMPKLMGLYWVTAIVEVITYVPLLGAGGAYLSFVTGNISNLKLPCAINALENATCDCTCPCYELKNKLEAEGFRVTVDARNEKIGKKIREGQIEKVPYMLVVGDRDMENGTVSPRHRADGDLGAMDFADFAKILKEVVDTKAKK